MSTFIFADEYKLEEGKTKFFYQTFLKGFIHKSNNLIGAIQGFSGLLVSDDSINDEIKKNLDYINSSSESLSKLNQLSITSSGISKCNNHEDVSLNEKVSFWISEAEKICDEHNVNLQVNISDNIPKIKGYPSKIYEIFIHLINNAVEESKTINNGIVAVDLLPPNDITSNNSVSLLIRNSSRSIDLEALSKLFIPFETSKDGSHYGLGLTTCAILANQMKMKLGISNSNNTTTVWLDMPI